MGLSGAGRPESRDWQADWRLHQELQALARGRLCGPAHRRRCRAENGPFADWACKECQELVRPEVISPWTWHLIFLYRLSRAGYPFQANDLSLETWLLLSTVRRVMEGGERGPHGQR